MPAAWLLASRDLRRRAAAWALLAVLIGLLGATALATAAGARRSASAFSRFIRYSHDADADVLGFGAPPGALDKVAALPQVAHAFKASLVPIVPSGPEESRFDNGLIVSEDEGFLNGTIVRPTFLEGRQPHLSDPKEVAVNESMASRTGVHAGGSLTFGVLSGEQLERAGQGEALGAPEGPRITVRVAGVIRLPSDLAQTASQGIVFASGAFYRTWAPRLSLDTGLLAVSLRSPALRPAFARAAIPVLQGATLQFRDDRVVTDATRVQAFGLAAVSGIVAVCALVALGQALTRAGALSDAELAARTAVGLTRRQRMWASALPALWAIGAGAVFAVVLAFLGSGLFPRGVARRAEPTPGLHADPAVLLLGGLAVLVTLGAWVLVASRLAVRGRRRLPSRASWSSRITERTALGVGPALGVRFALERGRGGRATPTTSSVAAAVVGVAGVIGVTVFGGSLGHLFSTPALAGAPWDAEISTIPGPFLNETEGMVDTPAFAGVAAVRTLEVVVGGAAAEGYSFDVRRGSGFLTVLDGRAPVGAGEAALGSRTLRRMGLSIGDTVGVSGPSGRRVSARVVGRVALPVLDTDIDRISDGVVLSPRAIDVLAAGDDERSGAVLVQFADPADAQRRLGAVARRFGLPGIDPPPEPREVSNMRPVRGLLGAIGLLTGLLAALSVVHLLVTGVRRRRGDLAILRALGLSPGEARSVIRWQSVTVAAVAAGLGVPAGVVVGRAAWTTVAGQLGVADAPVVRLLLLAAVAGAFVAGTLAVATIPGRRAAALRPAAVLRAD